ncbi:MAG TPA: serine/threonine-protein kinase [Ktedonobacteraceae bacterium]
MICPNCGTENRPGDHFCEECGAALVANNAVLSTSTDIPGGLDASSNIVTNPAAGLTPGVSLQNGRYVITKALGEGGMGSVLLAKDTRLADKLTVVKVLNADSSDTEKLHEDVRNFKREAETLAHLNHPLIPDVTDHFEEGSRYYMVMDYVDGENLEHWLERTRQPMTEEDVLRYALEVLDILEYLSRQQPAIVHRDIKPANIIIGAQDKHAHLVDFGIARAKTTLNGQMRKTTALGTPGYAPPEQYQGYADPRSDLYALAATIHHLITNRDPGDNAPFQFPPVRTLNPRVSPQLERILSKALKTAANERYQTPQEMRRDLEALVAGTPLLGTTDGYKISGTLSALPEQTQLGLRPRQPAAPSPSKGEELARAAERVRQRQTRPPDYGENSYQFPREQTTQQQQRQIFEPQPLRPYSPPRQQQSNNYRYSNNFSNNDDNQLMWRFIFFVVAICAIALLAFVLFHSLVVPF